MRIKDIYYYAQGNIRYELFYKYKFLILTHIREQIIYRINSMDTQCYEEGQCKMCGCATTALQMCNKACDKPCYPSMLSRKEWKEAIDKKRHLETGPNKAWVLDNRNLRFVKVWNG